MTDDQAKNIAAAKRLSEMLDDPDNVGFYYRLAEQNDSQFLFQICRAYGKGYERSQRT